MLERTGSRILWAVGLAFCSLFSRLDSEWVIEFDEVVV